MGVVTTITAPCSWGVVAALLLESVVAVAWFRTVGAGWMGAGWMGAGWMGDLVRCAERAGVGWWGDDRLDYIGQVGQDGGVDRDRR